MLTLGEFLIQEQHRHTDSTGSFSKVIHALRLAFKVVSYQVKQAGLVDLLGAQGAENCQGEAQQKLDLLAHETFINTLTNRNVVCGIASEEESDFIDIATQHPQGDDSKYIVLLDPLDGSSNIDVNVSVGTIFSIYKRKSPVGGPVEKTDFLQKGSEQLGAGYILYGTSTMFVYTTGDGVHGFTLNPAIGTYYLSHPNMKMARNGSLYSINEAYFSSFPNAIQRYLIDQKKKDTQYSTRYIGSMVSDIHRNMLKGGVFLYPPNQKNLQGKLRLLYECNPMAFITEQAGGRAIGMNGRILDVIPTALHQRSPFFCGSTEMVTRIERYLNAKQ